VIDEGSGRLWNPNEESQQVAVEYGKKIAKA